MAHWGWYWKIKRQHIAKPLCSWQQFVPIDSFAMFKNKVLVDLVHESDDKNSFNIPCYNLIATLMPNNHIQVVYDGGAYVIPVEEKPCNYGGVYHFFRCPQCSKRVRKLYCKAGRYACRKCHGLGYYTQRLRTSERHFTMGLKVKNRLINRAGSLHTKPPRMWTQTFNRLRQKYVTYDEKWFHASNQDLRDWYGARAEPYIDDWYFPPEF